MSQARLSREETSWPARHTLVPFAIPEYMYHRIYQKTSNHYIAVARVIIFLTIQSHFIFISDILHLHAPYPIASFTSLTIGTHVIAHFLYTCSLCARLILVSTRRTFSSLRTQTKLSAMDTSGKEGGRGRVWEGWPLHCVGESWCWQAGGAN